MWSEVKADRSLTSNSKASLLFRCSFYRAEEGPQVNLRVSNLNVKKEVIRNE